MEPWELKWRLFLLFFVDKFWLLELNEEERRKMDLGQNIHPVRRRMLYVQRDLKLMLTTFYFDLICSSERELFEILFKLTIFGYCVERCRIDSVQI